MYKPVKIDRAEIQRRALQSKRDKQAAARAKPKRSRKDVVKATRNVVEITRPLSRLGLGPSKQSEKSLVAQERSFATVGSSRSKTGDTSVRIRGRDMLAMYNFAGTANFQTLDNKEIAPLCFPSTKLSLLASLYDKFTFNSLTFRWVPASPTTTTGGLIMTWDSDPTDATPPQTVAGLRELSTHPSSIQFPPWQEASVSIGPSNGFVGYTDGQNANSDERLIFQGQWYLATTSACSAAVGVVWLEYDVTFMDPQVNSTAMGAVTGSFGFNGPVNITAASDVLANCQPAANNNPQIKTATLPLNATTRTALVIPPCSQVEISYWGQLGQALTNVGSVNTTGVSYGQGGQLLPPGVTTTLPISLQVSANGDWAYSRFIIANTSLQYVYWVPSLTYNNNTTANIQITIAVKFVPLGSNAI